MDLDREADKIAKQIKLPREKAAQPGLVVVVGLPGSGKSHFSRRLAERVGAAIINTDMVRRTLSDRPCYSAQESYLVYRISHMLIKRLLDQGYYVIFDATNLQESGRKKLYKIAEEVGAKLVIVRMVVSEHIAHQRLRKREERPSPGDLSEANWAVYEYMKPGEERIRREHIVVDSSQDITPALDEVEATLQARHIN
jgi:predicted kinase